MAFTFTRHSTRVVWTARNGILVFVYKMNNNAKRSLKLKRNVNRSVRKGWWYMFTCLWRVRRDLRLVIEESCDPRLNGVDVRSPIADWAIARSVTCKRAILDMNKTFYRECTCKIVLHFALLARLAYPPCELHPLSMSEVKTWNTLSRL